MRVYFDTNIYSMIATLGDGNRVKTLLQDLGARVLVSKLNLLELEAIPSSASRQAEMDVLLSLPTSFETAPLAYRHSLEVLGELRRLRQEWVRPLASTRVRAVP